MIKRTVCFTIIFLLTSFAIMDAKAYQLTYGFIDYINILFCNVSTYPLYHRSNLNIINFLSYITMLYIGIYYISEKLYTYSKGFRSLSIIRYNSFKQYFNNLRKENILISLQYITLILVCVFLGLLIFENKSISLNTNLLGISTAYSVFVFILFLIKIILFLNIIEIYMSLFILNLKFEFILLMFMALVSMLLFTDVLSGTHFISFSEKSNQLMYIAAYTIIYLFSNYFVKSKYKKKEIW